MSQIHNSFFTRDYPSLSKEGNQQCLNLCRRIINIYGKFHNLVDDLNWDLYEDPSYTYSEDGEDPSDMYHKVIHDPLVRIIRGYHRCGNRSQNRRINIFKKACHMFYSVFKSTHNFVDSKKVIGLYIDQMRMIVEECEK